MERVQGTAEVLRSRKWDEEAMEREKGEEEGNGGIRWKRAWDMGVYGKGSWSGRDAEIRKKGVEGRGRKGRNQRGNKWDSEVCGKGARNGRGVKIKGM